MTGLSPTKATADPASALQAIGLRHTLILMACGGRKADTHGQAVPLVELYQGPMWTTLRKHLGDAERLRELDARVLVLSGGLGFVSALTPARPYEARLRPGAADSLIAGGIRALSAGGLVPLQLMAPPSPDGAWRAVIAAGGSDYRRVFLSWIGELRACGAMTADALVLATHGPIGKQRSQLGGWLRILTPCGGKDHGTERP